MRYIEEITFINDMKIIFNTILKVLKRADINSSDQVTMERFTGTKQQNY